MDSLLNFGATIIVAIIGLVGIVIQTKSKEKIENTNSKLDQFHKESLNGDAKLSAKLDVTIVQLYRIWLTTELTKVRDGVYKPNEEQKRLLIETKSQYNERGGDSYVDDMFDECKAKNLI